MKTTQCLLLLIGLIATVAGCAAPPDQQGSLTVKGSDTMVQLGQRWAETYMKEHSNTTIQVTGGGSGTGIAALVNGSTQICQSSRPMKDEEKSSVKQQRGADVVEVPVALDSLAIYINKQNPVEHLSLDQLRRLFRSEITNWKEVGGPDATIVLYGRENSSGTYVYFKEHVLANADFAENYQALPGTAAVTNAVAKDVAGIGYGGIGYAAEIKTVPVAKDASSAPVTPTMENVYNGSYPLSRSLFWYTAGPLTGTAKEFQDWVLSPEGQKVVTDVGYYPLKR
jgi:phosphate transport system substrate-binding protein